MIPPQINDMNVNLSELFYSIQGESTRAGLPCTFVRFAECNLRCTWCDSRFSFKTSLVVPLSAIVAEVERVGCSLVEITGGEPLLQRAAVEALAAALFARGKTVMMETTLSMELGGLDPRIIKIVDIKPPGSGMEKHMRWDEIENLTENDELKFVLASREDFDWSLDVISRYPRLMKFPILFSPALGKIQPNDLAEWILESGAPVRMQVQLHKFLTTEETRDSFTAHRERLAKNHPALVAAAIPAGDTPAVTHA
jgi:7-carboxy-7-deazaguanine synthase